MKLILVAVCLCLVWSGSAQRTVSGRTVTADGSSIAYVNLGIEGTTVGVNSDRDGSFSLRIPAGTPGDTLAVSHVSYKTLKVPVAALGDREIFTLTPRDHVVPEIVVTAGKRKKRTLEGHGVRFPGVAGFVRDSVDGTQKYDTEIGSLVEVDDNFLITDFDFRVLSNNGDVKVRVNVCRIEDDEARNILHYPIYVDLEKHDAATEYSIVPEEAIVLGEGSYFIGLEIVEGATSEDRLEVMFPIFAKAGMSRSGKMGPFEKLPFNIGLVVRGYVLAQDK